MNTNNTERGGDVDGWEYVTIDDVEFRCMWDNGLFGFEWFDREANEWCGSGGLGDSGWTWLKILQVIHAERTATRDRDAALAEMMKHFCDIHSFTDPGDTAYISYGRIQQWIDALEALLTNPTAHVEADRQGDEKLAEMQTKLSNRWGWLAANSHGDKRDAFRLCIRELKEELEALHGTEGVKG